MLFDIQIEGAPDTIKSRYYLIEFSKQLETFLSGLVSGDLLPNFFGGILNDDARYLQPAFNELREEIHAFRDLKMGIEEISDDLLIKHGLSGQNLTFKINTLSSSSQQIVQASEREDLSGLLMRPVRKVLKYLLKLINSILGSLQSAIAASNPVLGGAVHAVKELKDYIEAKVDLVGDLSQ